MPREGAWIILVQVTYPGSEGRANNNPNRSNLKLGKWRPLTNTCLNNPVMQECLPWQKRYFRTMKSFSLPNLLSKKKKKKEKKLICVGISVANLALLSVTSQLLCPLATTNYGGQKAAMRVLVTSQMLWPSATMKQ